MADAAVKSDAEPMEISPQVSENSEEEPMEIEPHCNDLVEGETSTKPPRPRSSSNTISLKEDKRDLRKRNIKRSRSTKEDPKDLRKRKIKRSPSTKEDPKDLPKRKKRNKRTSETTSKRDDGLEEPYSLSAEGHVDENGIKVQLTVELKGKRRVTQRRPKLASLENAQ